MNRPYVYRRAEDLGIPVTEGKATLPVVVTDADVVKAKQANSKLCALSRASLRLPGVRAAYFFRSMAFLEYADRIDRYALPVSVQKEIVSFDRSGIFASGLYHLRPPSPGTRRAAMRKYASTRRAEGLVGSTPKDRAIRAAAISDAIVKVAAQEYRQDTPEQRAFDERIAALVGGRVVAGARRPDAPKTAKFTPARYAHRTQYVRDIRDPDGDS